MKIFSIIFILFIISACGTDNISNVNNSPIIGGYQNDKFYVIEIEGCEYVVYHGIKKGCIIHKENCRNHK